MILLFPFLFSLHLGSQIAGVYSVGNKGLETVEFSRSAVASAHEKDIKIFYLEHTNSKLE